MEDVEPASRFFQLSRLVLPLFRYSPQVWRSRRRPNGVLPFLEPITQLPPSALRNAKFLSHERLPLRTGSPSCRANP